MNISSDKVFNIINNDNKKFYRNLLEIENLLDFKCDKTCLRNLLEEYNLIIRHQKCYGCRLFDNLYKYDTIPEKIKILVGKYKYNSIEIVKSNQDIFRVKYFKDFSHFLNNYNDWINNYYKSEKHYLETKFYGASNPNLNRVIINNIIYNIIKEKNFIKSNKYLYHYICNNRLAEFNFSYEVDSLDELLETENYNNREICKKILLLIIFYFKYFSNYYFIHNMATVDSLKFDLDLVNLKINDKDFYSPVRVYIEPSIYSSITIFKNQDAKRYFYNGYMEKDINTLPFESIDIDINNSKNYNFIKLDIEYSKDYLKKRLMFYKIGNREKDFLNLRRYQGIPLVSKSFDIVCLFTSLVVNKKFYNYFIETYSLISLWKGLWKIDEYDRLTKDLDSLRSKNLHSFDNIFNIIKKYYIRFDALDYLYYSLSTS